VGKVLADSREVSYRVEQQQCFAKKKKKKKSSQTKKTRIWNCFYLSLMPNNFWEPPPASQGCCVPVAWLAGTHRRVKLLPSGIHRSKTTRAHLECSRPAGGVVASTSRCSGLFLIDTFLTAWEQSKNPPSQLFLKNACLCELCCV